MWRFGVVLGCANKTVVFTYRWLQSIISLCCRYHSLYYFYHSDYSWSCSTLLPKTAVSSWMGELPANYFICVINDICVILSTIWMSVSRLLAVADWRILFTYFLVAADSVLEGVSSDWNLCWDVHPRHCYFPHFIDICFAVGNFLWINILHDFFPSSKLSCVVYMFPCIQCKSNSALYCLNYVDL